MSRQRYVSAAMELGEDLRHNFEDSLDNFGSRGLAALNLRPGGFATCMYIHVDSLPTKFESFQRSLCSSFEASFPASFSTSSVLDMETLG